MMNDAPERMPNEEYKETQNMLLAVGATVSEMRLDLFLGRITEATVLGQGQIWEETKSVMDELANLAKSAQEMKETMIRIALLQKKASSGGRIIRVSEGGHA